MSLSISLSLPHVNTSCFCRNSLWGAPLSDMLSKKKRKTIMAEPPNPHEARQHLHAMVELANRLISESINQTDPVLPPERTIKKDDFLREYLGHSNELCKILDSLNESDQNVENCDQKVEKSRNDLAILVKNLQEKLDKLNDLRFWMDNMIFDGNGKQNNEA